MNTHVKEMFEQVQRSLSDDEKIELADWLYADAIKPDSDWEAAWIAEAERRLEAIERGEMALIDAEVVHARLRAKFGLE